MRDILKLVATFALVGFAIYCTTAWTLSTQYFFSADDFETLTEARTFGIEQIFTVLPDKIAQPVSLMAAKALRQTFDLGYRRIHVSLAILHLMNAILFGLTVFYWLRSRRDSEQHAVSFTCFASALFAVVPGLTDQTVTLGWLPPLMGTLFALGVLILYSVGLSGRYRIFDTALILLLSLLAMRASDAQCLVLPLMLLSIFLSSPDVDSILTRRKFRILIAVTLIAVVIFAFLNLSSLLTFGTTPQLGYSFLPLGVVLVVGGLLQIPSTRYIQPFCLLTILGLLFFAARYRFGTQSLTLRAANLTQKIEDKIAFENSYPLRHPIPTDTVAIINIPERRKTVTIFANNKGNPLTLLFGQIPYSTKEYRRKVEATALSETYVIDYNRGQVKQVR